MSWRDDVGGLEWTHLTSRVADVPRLAPKRLQLFQLKELCPWSFRWLHVVLVVKVEGGERVPLAGDEVRDDFESSFDQSPGVEYEERESGDP